MYLVSFRNLLCLSPLLLRLFLRLFLDVLDLVVEFFYPSVHSFDLLVEVVDDSEEYILVVKVFESYSV